MRFFLNFCLLHRSWPRPKRAEEPAGGWTGGPTSAMHGWSCWGDQDWKEFHNKKTHTAAAGEWNQNNNAAQADQIEQSTASATTRPADSAAVRAERYACLVVLPAHVFNVRCCGSPRVVSCGATGRLSCTRRRRRSSPSNTIKCWRKCIVLCHHRRDRQICGPACGTGLRKRC